jgi:hypothetical protein
MDFLTDRTIIIALAILGAGLATAGSMLMGGSGRAASRSARAMLWIGYLVSAASVLAFIVAGFLSSR